MYKIKNDNREVTILLIILVVITIVLTGFSKDIKNYFNILYEKVFYSKNEIIISFEDGYVDELIDEIDDLKLLLDIDNSAKYYYKAAIVLYRNPSFWYNNLIINKGYKDGINKNDIIVNEKGVIGIVDEVMNDSSSVMLITNILKDNKITVGIRYNEETIYGLISEYNYLTNEFVITDVIDDITYMDNISVYTTSFTNTFKEGMKIGSVKRIEDSDDNLSKIIIATPEVNFNNIKYVCIVGKE